MATNARVTIGIGLGLIVVALAITAGRQYGHAQQQAKIANECHVNSLSQADRFKESLAQQDALFAVISAQRARIKELESTRGAMHNTSGGYIASCGSLPGLVGDDC